MRCLTWRKQRQAAKGSIFSYTGIPPAGQLIPLGLQHVVAAVVGVITPAILISGTCNLSTEDQTLLIQVSLIMTALATLLQLFPVLGRIGRPPASHYGAWALPMCPRFRPSAWILGLPAILGAELVGGIVAILFGIFVKQIRVLFPPLVTGTVIFTIGLSLYPTAIRYMAAARAATTWLLAELAGGGNYPGGGLYPPKLSQGCAQAGLHPVGNDYRLFGGAAHGYGQL